MSAKHGKTRRSEQGLFQGATSGSDNYKIAGASSEKETANKPRNVMVLDATAPLQFAWQGRFGLQHVVTVDQTPDEDTWPGGAVWDLGWCMSHLLVALSAGGKATTTTTTTTTTSTGSTSSSHSSGKMTRRRTISTGTELAVRINDALLRYHQNWPDPCKLPATTTLMECNTILELGCGVGLTGLVAALSLRPKVTVLTDLKSVIDKVTLPNVKRNSNISTSSTSRRKTTGPILAGLRTMGNNGQCKIIAVPLCWGDANDEQAVLNILKALATSNETNAKKKNDTSKSKHCSERRGQHPYLPDLVLIGDVAYQHKPGDPSHFDALLSTLLQFVDEEHTLVLFGTRIRMPASGDLLDMLLEEFIEIAKVTADEIDAAAFADFRHLMSIHLLKRKSKQTKGIDGIVVTR